MMLFSPAFFFFDRFRRWFAVAGIALLMAAPLLANPCQIRFSTPRGANVQPQNTTRTADTLSSRPLSSRPLSSRPLSSRPLSSRPLSSRPQRPAAQTAPIEPVRVMSNDPGRLVMLDSLAWFSYPRDVGFTGIAKPAIRPAFVVSRAPDRRVPDSTATSGVLMLPGSTAGMRTAPASSRPSGTADERGIRPRRGTTASPP